jgi:hypothetical protein
MGILQWGNLVAGASAMPAHRAHRRYNAFLADTKILARDEAGMHGRGLATTANMTQTVCDTVFLHSCAMQVQRPSRHNALPLRAK